MGKPELIILKTDRKQPLCNSVQVPLEMDDRWPQQGSTRMWLQLLLEDPCQGGPATTPMLASRPEGIVQILCSLESRLPKWWGLNSAITLPTCWMVGSFPFSSYIPCWGPRLKRQCQIQTWRLAQRKEWIWPVLSGRNMNFMEYPLKWDLNQIILLHFFSAKTKQGLPPKHHVSTLLVWRCNSSMSSFVNTI